MSKTSDLAQRRVDAFVGAVNSSPRSILARAEIPEQCRLSEGEWPGTFNWQITLSAGADWLPKLEGRLPFRLPPTFRSLIARYLFPSFETGPLTFYSVGVRDSDSHGTEFRLAIFGDHVMSPLLLKHGLLPFARPADGSYDPVCFDYRVSRRRLEPAVLRIDHEEILCNERIRIVESLAQGFDMLIEETTRQLQSRAEIKR